MLKVYFIDGLLLEKKFTGDNYKTTSGFNHFINILKFEKSINRFKNKIIQFQHI